MKTQNHFARACFAGLSLAAAFTACGSDAPTLTDAQSVVPSFFYSDSSGKPIDPSTPDTMPISKISGDQTIPVTAPDGHTVTWGEFRIAGGTAQLTCEDGGTRIHLDAQHLLPRGVYTGWLVFFQAPGFPVNMLDSLTGLAPVGPSDGSQSKTIADANGNASLDALIPAGQVTVPAGATQAIPSCLLDAFEVHVVLAYHPDGQTYGSSPGSFIAEHVSWLTAAGKVE